MTSSGIVLPNILGNITMIELGMPFFTNQYIEWHFGYTDKYSPKFHYNPYENPYENPSEKSL